MTITMGVVRPDFAVLGADRLWSWVGHSTPGAADVGTTEKLVIHSHLPMAAAVAGIAEFTTGVEPIDVVRQALETMGDAIGATHSFLGVPMLCGLLASRLQPLVQQERSSQALRGAPAEAVERVRVDVTFGGFMAGEAVLVSYRIGDTTSSTRSTGVLHPPHTIEDFCVAGEYASVDRRFGHDLQEPAELAAHVHDLLQACIAEECRRYGRNIKIGGGVDVVLVERAGARPWQRSDAVQS